MTVFPLPHRLCHVAGKKIRYLRSNGATELNTINVNTVATLVAEVPQGCILFT
jgi:hypothetical protein